MKRTVYCLYYGIPNAHDDFDGEWVYYCEFPTLTKAVKYMEDEKLEDAENDHVFFYKIEKHIATLVLMDETEVSE